MCRFFHVSRSGYYGFVHKLGKPEKDAALAQCIAQQQDKCFQTYGYRRMYLWLERQGIHHNPQTILRVMKKLKPPPSRPHSSPNASGNHSNAPIASPPLVRLSKHDTLNVLFCKDPLDD